MVFKLNSRFFHMKILLKSGLWNLNWPISQVLLLNQSPISVIPLIVQNFISQKTVLTGDPLYMVSMAIYNPEFSIRFLNSN